MPDSADRNNADKQYIQLDETKTTGAAAAAPVRRRTLLAGVLSAACVALIVVSLGFVSPAEGGAWSLTWLVSAVTGQSSVTATTIDAKSESSSSADKAKDKKSSESKGESKGSDKSKDDASDGKASQDASSDEKTGSKDGASGSTDSSSNGSAAGQSSTGGESAASGGSSSGSSNAADSSSPSGSATPAPDSNRITVTVSVTSSAVGNPVSSGGTFTFVKGATVYDALCALGLSVNARGSQYGTYVAAIGGLAEKEHGGTSGWMYSVNGVSPNVACSGYQLSDGDNVVWYYVTG